MALPSLNQNIPQRYDAVDADLASIDGVLSTTRSVRLRLDFDRHVDNKTILDCIDLAEQGPGGGNQSSRRWLVIRDPKVKTKLAELYYQSAGQWMVSAREKLAGTDHRNRSIMNSAAHLAENIPNVPALVIPCIWGRHDDSKKPGLFDSVLQSAWSFCLAARARGLATAWTSAILTAEDEMREILDIPIGVTPVAMLPLAYSKGTAFNSVPRRRAAEVTYYDSWGRTWETRDDASPRKVSEGPGAICEIEIEAPPEIIWKFVSDINLSAEYSEEFQGAEWAPGYTKPELGAKFIGTNQHKHIGEWQTTSTITEFEDNVLFGWAVGDNEETAGARWRWEIDELHGKRSRLRHTLRLGPGASGLTPAIESMPDKEELIISRRLEEHLSNMRKCLSAIKVLAES